MEAAEMEETQKEDSLIDPIYQKFTRGVERAIGSTEFYEFFMDAVSRAQNEFQFSNRKLIKTVDVTWVDAIEDSLKAMQNIIDSPRNVIKEEDIIVNVANARKSGAETVRHLAQHSSLVENFDEGRGEVRPNKLMQRYREESIGLYENRLVYTTMEYAAHFVKIRHDALFEAMSDEFGAKLKVKSEMDTASEHVHVDMFLHIKEIDGALETDAKNGEIFARISRIYRVLNIYMNSPFAQQMDKLPRVKGAVSKTNILKRNPDYKAVLKLWEFLRSYDNIGYAIKVVEHNPEVNERFQQDIYRNILFQYLILKGYLEDEEDRQIPTKAKGRKRTLKPKFIHQIVEELTEDYDLPDVEVRKVLIEELTKEQLMQEEAAERRRLVEEQAARKKAEEDRLRAEKKAQEEKLRAEKAAERERKRQEAEAEKERLRQEQMERELEDSMRGKLFRTELAYFKEHLEEQLELRQQALEAAKKQQELEDYADAVRLLEEAEQRKKEEAAREKKRRQEERERQKYEEELARRRQQAEEERLRKEQEEREAAEALRLQKEQEEALEAQKALDREHLAVYLAEVAEFAGQLAGRIELRRQQEAKRQAEELARRQAREARRSKKA
jgi:hypothetical protein